MLNSAVLTKGPHAARLVCRIRAARYSSGDVQSQVERDVHQKLEQALRPARLLVQDVSGTALPRGYGLIGRWLREHVSHRHCLRQIQREERGAAASADQRDPGGGHQEVARAAAEDAGGVMHEE